MKGGNDADPLEGIAHHGGYLGLQHDLDAKEEAAPHVFHEVGVRKTVNCLLKFLPGARHYAVFANVILFALLDLILGGKQSRGRSRAHGEAARARGEPEAILVDV